MSEGNMQKLRICIVCGHYPTKEDPSGAFVRPLVCSLADKGVECIVVCPQDAAASIKRKKKLRPSYWVDKSEKERIIQVFQPIVLTLSDKVPQISSNLASRAIKKLWKKKNLSVDVVYSYFWHEGVLAANSIDEIPIIVQSSESKIRVFNQYSKECIERAKERIKGVVAVAGKSLKESKECGLVTESMKTVIIPNAIDTKEFYVTNKDAAREKLCLPKDEVLVCFVGSFIERKGPNRLIEAARDINGIKLIMIGSGGELNDSKQIVFQGAVPHSQVLDYLNASDLFVLPTLNEGCCNAIIEAMACGLPVISSDLSFNDEILDQRYSVRVDTSSIEQIRDALKALVEDPEKRMKMSIEAQDKAKEFSIDNRAYRIIEFIREVIS